MFTTNILIYTGILLTALTGIPLGNLIAFYAKDEIHEYKNLLHPIQQFLMIIFFTIIFVTTPTYISIIILFSSIIFLYISWKRLEHNLSDILLLSVLLVITSISKQNLFLSSITLFLFSFITGLIIFILHTKPPSKKTTDLRHHKHSKKDLKITKILQLSLKKYYLCFVFSIATFIIGQCIKLIFF